eukprot:CAMPEP_0170170940 /NCGR_PEP_ID=MMETSP0040_2-20121228/3987_1 /TAXON_ID=641309 /ORGANISM="Lotharella oceanica, Strain CCMP622" /LENGTH=58 /DNA_ID=CAMNT_0010410667 /DNA_START=58 /DNA_END=234 /DNA_ORIENTATION=-
MIGDVRATAHSNNDRPWSLASIAHPQPTTQPAGYSQCYTQQRAPDEPTATPEQGGKKH